MNRRKFLPKALVKLETDKLYGTARIKNPKYYTVQDPHVSYFGRLHNVFPMLRIKVTFQRLDVALSGVK